MMQRVHHNGPSQGWSTMETKASAISANAMMFDGEFFEAAALARKFAGDGGRIATMADVVQARRLAEHDELIWQRPIITSSSEYFGLSKFGTPIIIVAHGNGPLSDLEDVFISYCVSRGGQPKNGLISQAEFLRLESGAFGPVEVVPLAAVWQRKHPFQATITPEQAMEDPLVRARLGEIGDYYIARHRAISLEWAESKYLGSRGHECMLVNRDPNRQSYLSKEPDGNVASAHLLGVSDLVQYDHGHWDDDIRHTCLVSALSCYEWGDEGWVVGYRGGHMLRPHPGP